MADPEVREELGKRIEALSKQASSVDPKEILEAVESVMATINGDLSTVNLKLYSEIESLAKYIEAAKVEIAALRPDEITDEHLPNATDELQAIVGATEHATNSIFEAVEGIESLTEKMDAETAQAVTDAVTQVYEACSFQDITGQRITKVVTALQHIEAKVEALLGAFGDEIKRQPRPEGTPHRPRPDGKPERPDEHLMNGPAKASEAVSQEDIDALLASFD